MVCYAYIWDKGKDTIQALPVLPPSSSKVGFAIAEVDGGVQIEFDKFVVDSMPRSGETLFVSEDNKAFMASGFASAWQRAMKTYCANGHERFHEHDIRGKVATDIGDAATAQKLLGHQNISMTEDYIKQRKADEVMPHGRKQ